MKFYITIIKLLVVVNFFASESKSSEESDSTSESSEEESGISITLVFTTHHRKSMLQSEQLMKNNTPNGNEEEISDSSAEADESAFPFLNLTSITMLDEKNHPVKGFFTHTSSGRSAAEIEEEMSDIEYIVYTRKNLNGTVVKNAEQLKKTSFNPTKPVKLITHGWLSSGSADTCMKIKDGYLNTTDVNVIVMNWEEIASDHYYINPMRAVPKIAHHYAIFINDLIDKWKVNPKNLHLIGHSLGAQISGLVWKDMEGKKPGRVTGLDPAFPGFDHIIMFNDRISEDSGDFVDIIHSCGGILGILGAVGHADFYPNGGTAIQPGCSSLFEACSHGRSWQFFADSVKYRNRKFLATRCDSWDKYVSDECDDSENVLMGEQAPPTARGKYFLRTNKDSPFSLRKLH